MRVLFASSIAVATFAMTGADPARAVPVAAAGYSVTTFATGPTGTSGADSVEVIGGNVYVGYSNGTPKDGSGGTSTIVEYSAAGTVLNSTTVAGHTDGLRYNAATNQIWSMQNEDGNPNLVLVTPGTLAKSSVYTFNPVVNGGGYDDAVFVNGKAFLTASNPANNPNTDPALVSATLAASTVTINGVMNGNAKATALDPSAPTTLNLQDPDSLSLTQDGKVVLDSQADGQLVFITDPSLASQTVSVIQLLNGVLVDDTVFAGASKATLLVADKTSNSVYAVTGNFAYNQGISAAQDAALKGFVGALNPDGSYTQIVTGLGNPAGEAFLAVPEPASLALFSMGIVGLFGLRRRC